jgi:excisionase family DNA binding protein
MTVSCRDTSGRTPGSEPPAGISPELLSVHAVCTLLGGCSARHVYRMVDAGRMPRPVKLGSLCRWRSAELMRWLADGCPSVPAARAGRQ